MGKIGIQLRGYMSQIRKVYITKIPHNKLKLSFPTLSYLSEF